jgi:hypothetical protein
MKRSIFLLSISLFCIIAVSGQKRGDDKSQPATNPAEGIIYSLPRTNLFITVKLVKESYKPGPYAAFAEKYLGFQNVKTSASDNWKITEIKVETFGDPDPSAIFKTSGNMASMVSLQSDGAIAGINIPNTNTNPSLKGSDFIDKSNLPAILFPDQTSDDLYDIEINNETGSERIKFKTLEERAMYAAEYLFKIRKKRAFTILSPSDALPENGDGFEAFVKQAEKIDAEYVSLFLGKTFYSTHEFSVIYTPGNDNVRNDVLFRFSDEKGIVPRTDISGRPVTIELTKDQKQYSSIESLNQQIATTTVRSGFNYRIPVNANFSLSEGLNLLYNGKLPIAQFGFIAPLPESLLDEKIQVTYDKVTGTIQSGVKIK